MRHGVFVCLTYYHYYYYFTRGEGGLEGEARQRAGGFYRKVLFTCSAMLQLQVT